jgi:lambda family phage minor tail protein L
MKNITNEFIAEKNSRSNKPILLFILHNYDGNSNNLYFAKYDLDVAFDGQLYQKFPISVDSVTENSSGQIDAIRVSVCNVSRLIQSYLNDYNGLKGKKITIRIVWANLLIDPEAKMDFEVYIDSTVATDTDVVFTCTTKMDLLERQLPGEIYSRTHCQYRKFKDPATCGYSGSETECNRTKQRCKELGNFQRFGAFPSIPTNRIYIV